LIYRITGAATLQEPVGKEKYFKIPVELMVVGKVPENFEEVVEITFYRTGDKGAQGEKGEPGEKGATGEKGEKGATGEKGEKGTTGEKGEKGATGEKGEKGATGAEGRWASLAYSHLTNTEETEPAVGNLKFNAGKTSLFISETDGDGGGISAYLATWDDSTTTALRGFVMIRKVGTPATFAIYKVTGALVDKGTWDSIPVALVSSNGAFGNGDKISVEFYRTGDKGEQGEKGEKGATGEKGEKGATGEKGEKGEKGEPGPHVLTETTEPIEFKDGGAVLREEIHTEVPEANNHLIKLKALAEKAAELAVRGGTAVAKTFVRAIANGFERTIVDGEGQSSFLQWSQKGKKEPLNVNARQVIKGSLEIPKEATELAEVVYPFAIAEPKTDAVVVWSVNLAKGTPYAQYQFEAGVGLAGLTFKRAEKGSAGRLYYILILGT